jgi:hypothetical protein
LGLQHDSDSNVQAEAAKRLVELAEQDKIKLINVTEAIDWIIEQLRENRPVYTVSNYASDGSWCEANPAEFHSLEEAREEVGRRLGDLRDWRKWSGLPDDNDVEAYHASREDGCGGVAISKE